MSEYEHLVTLWCVRDYPNKSFESWLDDYGKLGWRLVVSTHAGLSTECIFVREVERE